MLPKPNSQVKFILHYLITHSRGIAERDTNFNMFRGHISNLRKHITIKHTDVPFVNIFKHKGKYRRHWLTETEKKKATKYYLSLFK
jgi:hypothetical protein